MPKKIKVLNLINAIYIFVLSVFYFLLTAFGLIFAASGPTNYSFGAFDIANLFAMLLFSVLLFYGGILILRPPKSSIKYLYIMILTLAIMVVEQLIRLIRLGWALRLTDLREILLLFIPFALAVAASLISRSHLAASSAKNS